MYGEPGTGKTLLAKAVVSSRPFFSPLLFGEKKKLTLFRSLHSFLPPLPLSFLPSPSFSQANSTSATFLRVVGSELIQKYLGDGPKLVRELFKAADEMAPSIVFIDEVDAIGTKRYDSQSGGEREIQRTMLEVSGCFW